MDVKDIFYTFSVVWTTSSHILLDSLLDGWDPNDDHVTWMCHALALHLLFSVVLS